MTEKIHEAHWCRCGAWGSFGTRINGTVVWTCGIAGCAKQAMEGLGK